MQANLEVCVDTAAGVQICSDEGVDRIELCAALSVGGLTPALGLMEFAAGLPVPAHVMIRPRSGDFVFNADEVAVMCADIAAVKHARLAGVVLGASTADGALDVETLKTLIAKAGSLELTLHRVVDTLTDPSTAVELAIELGFKRILTSGGAMTADKGLAMIAKMNNLSKGRIEIMAGSGLSPVNLREIARATGVRHFHASCRENKANSARISSLGFGPAQQPVTSANRIREMKDILNQLGDAS